MVKKVLLIVSVCALVAVFGAANVFADDGEDECPPTYNEDLGVWVNGYCDGRLNAFDIVQSVAVYYDHAVVTTSTLKEDEDGEEYWEQSAEEVISAIDVWGVTADGVGYQALVVPAAAVEAAKLAGVDAVLGSAHGITLGYSPSGYLWVSGPDGYTFVWEAW